MEDKREIVNLEKGVEGLDVAKLLFIYPAQGNDSHPGHKKVPLLAGLFEFYSLLKKLN